MYLNMGVAWPSGHWGMGQVRPAHSLLGEAGIISLRPHSWAAHSPTGSASHSLASTVPPDVAPDATTRQDRCWGGEGN